MSSNTPRKLTIAAMIVLAVSSVYFILVLQFLNGTMDILESYAGHLPPTPAGDAVPLRLKFTSTPLDGLVSRLTPFYWPLITGAMPELNLVGIYMGAQVVASEVLLLVDGERTGNRGRIFSYSTIWSLVWQNVPWGLVQPIYNAIHLITGPAKPPSTVSVSGNVKAISTIPWAITIGYIVPSVLMSLPSPQLISHETHQAFLFIWQFFPLWVGLAHVVLKAFVGFSSDSQRTSLSALRRTYAFGLVVAGASHFSILFYVLALTFGPPNVKGIITSVIPPSFVPTNPSLVFSPFPPFTSPQAKVSRVEVGIASLLQYDTIFAGFSSLLLASYLASRVSGTSSSGGFVRAVAYTLLFGPCGAALAVMWKKDEGVFAAERKGLKTE
ncbi:hypothetical protein D9613_010905 [Agrocybe pediades]|uniref:Uncharacterized protein n=1 Tax=Agrocybe pediades TaxID=84607 RepID=A0A8H4QKT2_9AGAR|nr:hypothetical protein D9613_010905 [Agrocybe pediades]